MPDPSAPTLAGAAVRALVLPQLFTVAADGQRLPSLVVPGSDRDGEGGLSASFVLRPGATWSNGAPITVEDLRRTADARWVAGLEGPEPSGRITVRFTQPMPGWRRLWSDTAPIAAPAPDVWGGPFVVAALTPGLEAVLHRNEKWWGGPAPWLDEVRLVLVPDATTMRQLFERDELDVIAPPASTNRTALLGQAAHRGAGLVGRGAWDVRLVLNPKRLDDGSRRAIAGLVDWDAFAGTLLRGEASAAGGPGLGDAAALAVLKGKTVQVSGEIEEPMTGTLERAMQKRAAAAGCALELRNAESDRVEGWLAASDYDAAVVMAYEPPEGCLSCRDAGEVVSLWRPAPVVAWRGVEGVEVNGWALSPAWDAASWWRAAGTS